ncbi:SGNH/GDSL hydrolase family protein [Paenibacillus campinasensis]|uniref:Lysophospholipase n=1 Tax=Paenibacillus campinasensis TaxID=66347 RepID=A0A268EQB9_9BACL|nr:SGNH/GDSL hydrolase family protein [Paenibacillus campinasensis]PAD75320.1 lysophospholipase [Paenibacillus campinasensis]
MTKSSQTVLFQGDSITDGNRGRGDDPNHIHGHGYVYLIAAELGFRLADSRHQFINRGISGNRASDLYARWNEDAIYLQPNLISILIGVNDAGRMIEGSPHGASDRFEKAYRHILEETKDILPNTGLILCEPFVLRTGTTLQNWDKWRQTIDEYRQVVRILAHDYAALFVPLQKAFDDAAAQTGPEYWIWDGIHPTTAGHRLIANEWLNVVQSSQLALD